MDQQRAEKWLSRLFSLVGVLSATICITFGIAWYHWKDVLDTCGTYRTYEDPKCGCILHGKSTATYFTGGHIAICYWTTYGPLISVFLCFIFGCFHLYRVCCGVSPKRHETRTVRQRSGDLVVMTSRSEDSLDDISPYYWTPLGIMGVIMSIYMLVHASIYTDGYLTSCKQYRTELVKYMQATGPLVATIQGRLSCNAIFDFMDYIHPDVSYEKRRIDRINTPFALGIPFVATWMCVAGWIAIATIAFLRSRATKSVRV